MKKILIGLGSIALALAIFTGGVYASQWLNFTGDEQITQSDNHVNEIMDILRQVNDGKITAEQGLEAANERIAELEDMNPSGLAKQNNELRERVEKLEGTVELRDHTIQGLEEQLANAPEDQTDYVSHLEEELTKANNAVEQHNTTTSEAVEEARNYGGDE